MRIHPLDGALLLFDPQSGRSIHARGPATRHYRRRAPRVVQFAITNRCNLACHFCHRDQHAESGWTVDSAFELLRDLDHEGVLEVAFGGGEPFAFKGFTRLLQRLRETRLAVSITTNGLLLDGATLREIDDCYAELRVSLYDDISVLDRFAHARFGVNWLVTPERLPDLERVVLELSARGARNVVLLSYNGEESLHLDQDQSKDLGRRLGRLALALRGRTSIGTSVCFGERLDPLDRVVRHEGCDAGRDFIAITSDRCVQPCSFHRDKSAIATAADVLAVFARRADMAKPAQVRGCARLLPMRSTSEGDQTRISVYSAFASNNSGTYALVGSLPTEDAARELADIVRAVCIENSEWRKDEAAPGESPLDRFARELGMVADGGNVRDDDCWPDHHPPEILALGHQLIVHVDWTVTMPRIFGELIYKRGGRVAVEYVHAHHPIVAVLSFWVDRMWLRREEPELKMAFAEIERELSEMLPERHTWMASYGTSVAVVFEKLPEGIRSAQAIAERHGAKMHVQLIEAPLGTGDPLLAFRANALGAGAYQVVLWRIGEDRVAAMKAVRAASSVTLEAVQAMLGQLPAVVLAEVDEKTATRAQRLLAEAGCEAEAFIPAR